MTVNQFKINLEGLFDLVRHFDMRKAQILKNQNKLEPYMKETKENLANCMIEGGLFLINIDDSPETNYLHKYEPSLYEFYRSDSFPIHIREYNEIKAPECFSRVLKGTKYEGRKKINSNFYIAFWTAFQVEEGLDSATMRRKVEERFDVSFPIPQMDVLILSISVEELVSDGSPALIPRSEALRSNHKYGINSEINRGFSRIESQESFGGGSPLLYSEIPIHRSEPLKLRSKEQTQGSNLKIPSGRNLSKIGSKESISKAEKGSKSIRLDEESSDGV